KFSKDLEININHNLEKLSEFIRDTIHEKYGLAEMVKKGLAIHFGSLPQMVRVRIEEEYELGNIRYLFTTSTLLEGVNLPAKNIFVLSEKIGNSIMSDLDFRNLIGRAGRLSKELSGNIFIIRTDEKNGMINR
ncbi:TPA: helicase-related protein, partial [Streptococcus suis]